MRNACCSLLLITYLIASAEARATDLYLVSAGNNLGLAGEPALKYAERDATEIAAIMQRLGGVPAQNTVLALGEDSTTFRKVILDMNARIRATNKAVALDSILVVYFSGHADASGLHLGDTSLVFDELKTILAGSPAAVRLLIVDSCRSGGVTRVKGATEAEEFEIRLHNRLSAEGLAIITSSAAGEDSYESEQLRASFFSHHLTNALRGAADSDRDGRVTLDEAYRYTYQQTLSSSGRTLKLQHPTYQYDIKGKGELILTRLANDKNRSGRLVIAEPGFYLVIEGDEDGPVTAEVSVGQEGTSLVLPAGNYFIQKRSQVHYLEYELELKSGQEVELSEVSHETVEYARLLRKGGGNRKIVNGLYVMGGARGAMLSGQSVTPHLVLGTSLDLSWLSFGLRVRFSRGNIESPDGPTSMIHSEYGIGLTAQRFIDFERVSFSLGIMLEVAYQTQEFSTSGQARYRYTWSFGFGGLVGMEIEIIPELTLLIEGGPLTNVFRRSVVMAGAEVGSETASPFTWWAASGLGWRF
jgi:hypothetical protein